MQERARAHSFFCLFSFPISSPGAVPKLVKSPGRATERAFACVCVLTRASFLNATRSRVRQDNSNFRTRRYIVALMVDPHVSKKKTRYTFAIVILF